MVDFVEICNVCARKATIEAATRIINSDNVCHSYNDLNFGVTFLEHSVYALQLTNMYFGIFLKNLARTFSKFLPLLGDTELINM